MRDYNQLLAAAGADMSDIAIAAALGISPDGNWIGGAAVTPDTESGDTHPIFASLTATEPVPGDYNGDGIVDAADYVVWRKGLGTTFVQSDYDTWRDHFGQTAVSSSGAITNSAVPEPASIVTLIVGTLAICFRRQGPVVT